MKLSTEQQVSMYQNSCSSNSDHQPQQMNPQRSSVSSPGIAIGDHHTDGHFDRKMNHQDTGHFEGHRKGHFMDQNGHQLSNNNNSGHNLSQESIMSHHLHRMEFNGSGSDSHSSQSSGTSNEYHRGHDRNGHQEGHERVSDIAYPMMNLEEFIHQQTAGFSDQDSGSDRSGHSAYSGRDYDHEPKSGRHNVKSPIEHISNEFSPTDIALATSPDSQYHFDPSNVTFNSDELKPQPIISKSRKTLVPEGMKDNR